MNEAYRLTVCFCPEGSYIGARKAGTPDTCHRCGFITYEQWCAIQDQVRETL